MKYLQKVCDLNAKYKLGMEERYIQKVVARLELTKANYFDDSEWLSALDSIGTHLKHNPLLADIRKQAVAVNQQCPICKQPGESITLMGGRKAYYCASHHTVQPAIKEE